MDNDIKSGIGYIIPAAGVVGFFIALFMEETLCEHNNYYMWHPFMVSVYACYGINHAKANG